MSSPIIKHNLVRLEGSCPLKPGAKERPRTRKSARLVEIDGEARAIEVACPCGETILIELRFDAPAQSQGAKPQ